MLKFQADAEKTAKDMLGGYFILPHRVHVNHIVSSAFTRANLILKCFNSRNVQVLLRAFKVYVLPIIKYASSVWSPHLVTDIRKVESVQRKFRFGDTLSGDT